jgi:nucleotide-binding universal stress UspA family protein
VVAAYRAILVDAGLDAAATARVRLAAGLAERFDAHLIGLAACGVVPPVTGPFGETAMVVESIEAEERRIDAALQAAAEGFGAIAGAAGLSSEWRRFLDYPGDALARESRAADLLVIGRGGMAEGHALAEPSDVLMRSGRPTLVVPPDAAALEAKRVLVAWKESREARRAVADALPFLAAAEQVVVLAVCENADPPAQAQGHVDDVARLLSRHGANATGEVVTLSGRSVSGELRLAAERIGADLVVAGGYGHSQLLEWVLGGVTRDLLRHSPICCLLSH